MSKCLYHLAIPFIHTFIPLGSHDREQTHSVIHINLFQYKIGACGTTVFTLNAVPTSQSQYFSEFVGLALWCVDNGHVRPALGLVLYGRVRNAPFRQAHNTLRRIKTFNFS